MNRSFARWAALATATAACFLTSAATLAATITFSDDSCPGFTVGGSATAVTISCNASPPPPPPPGAPTNCSAAITTAPNPLTSSGGTATVTMTCDAPPAGSTISYSWKRNTTSNFSANNPLNDPLPANGGASGVTYTYTGTACTMPANACTTVSPSVSATVPGSGGGGGGGGGAISCAGFSSTVVIDEKWSNTSFPRLYTQNYGGFHWNDALIIRFTTGNLTAPGKNGAVTLVEYGSPPANMIVTLSASPCDFGPGINPPQSLVGPTSPLQMYYQVGGTPVAGGSPILNTNTTYYLNIRNDTNPNCAPTSGNPEGSCDKAIDFAKPRGL